MGEEKAFVWAIAGLSLLCLFAILPMVAIDLEQVIRFGSLKIGSDSSDTVWLSYLVFA